MIAIIRFVFFFGAILFLIASFEAGIFDHDYVQGIYYLMWSVITTIFAGLGE